jgi:hypothetical protein
MGTADEEWPKIRGGREGLPRLANGNRSHGKRKYCMIEEREQLPFCRAQTEKHQFSFSLSPYV